LHNVSFAAHCKRPLPSRIRTNLMHQPIACGTA
jgi:hypothetical protein